MPLVKPVASSLIPGLQRAVEACNDAAEARPSFKPFDVQGRTVGWLAPTFVETLSNFPTVFQVRLKPFNAPSGAWHNNWLCVHCSVQLQK
eukprot:scaffold154044_cov34-Prasinocladus_malaysianus.AAC.1